MVTLKVNHFRDRVILFLNYYTKHLAKTKNNGSIFLFQQNQYQDHKIKEPSKSLWPQILQAGTQLQIDY